MLDVMPVERIEQLTYVPSLQDTTDLEAATTAISAVAEPGTDNYSAALTLPAPSDTRLAVLRVAARLAVTIDSFNAGATHLYCRVYVDEVDADHLLFDLDLTAPAEQKLSAVDTHAASKAVIFALLKNGAAHTFKFRLWVDAGNAVVSLVQLWEVVGSCATGGWVTPLTLTHKGMATLIASYARQGSGNASIILGLVSGDGDQARVTYESSADAFTAEHTVLVGGTLHTFIWGSVATDINYIKTFAAVVRGEG